MFGYESKCESFICLFSLFDYAFIFPQLVRIYFSSRLPREKKNPEKKKTTQEMKIVDENTESRLALKNEIQGKQSEK